MAQDLINLEAFKGGPAKAFATLDPHAENLADGIGQSYGIIGYKGKVWSLRYRGEKKNFLRPDDGTPSSFIDVVILQSPPHKSKSYFKAYDAGNDEGPLCTSMDGIRPDAGVREKQADACNLCERNKWKQGSDGRKSRDCQDYKRLAVLVTPAQTKPLFEGVALVEAVFLRVPPASLNNLANLGEQMAAQGYHHSTYVTRITFDPAVAHPQMVFKAVKPLSEGEAGVVLPLRNDPLALRIIGKEASLPAPGASTQKFDTVSAPVSEMAQRAAAPQETAAAVVPTKAEEVSPSSLTLDTGFDTTPTPPKAAEAAPQTVEDVGVAETNEDMDARIAAMMAAQA